MVSYKKIFLGIFVFLLAIFNIFLIINTYYPGNSDQFDNKNVKIQETQIPKVPIVEDRKQTHKIIKKAVKLYSEYSLSKESLEFKALLRCLFNSYKDALDNQSDDSISKTTSKRLILFAYDIIEDKTIEELIDLTIKLSKDKDGVMLKNFILKAKTPIQRSEIISYIKTLKNFLTEINLDS